MNIARTIKLFIATWVGIAILGAGLVVPQKTYAYWGIFDTSFDSINWSTTLANWSAQIARWVKEDMMKALRDAVVKAIVNEINKETVAWIQGKGSPKFVSDWKVLAKTASDAAVNQVALNTPLGKLCSPFGAQLKIAFIPEKTYQNQISCTLQDMGRNIGNFYNNFQQGGWVAYGQSYRTENNFAMQLITQNDQIAFKKAESVDAQKSEAAAGSGFLSVKKCTGKSAQTIYDQCIAEGGNDSECSDLAAQNENEVCTTQTPGDAVAASVKNMIGSDNIYVAGVQSIISAAINAGLNRMMSEGLAMMSGTAPKGSGYNALNDPNNADLKGDYDIFNNDTNNTLIKQVQPFLDRFSELLDIKQKSLASANDIATYLSQAKTIQDKGLVMCPPPVTQQEIDNINTTKASLANDVGELQRRVNDAKLVINHIKGVDPNNVEQRMKVSDEVQNFVVNYTSQASPDPNNSSQTQLVEARKEGLDISAKWGSAAGRLDACRKAQAAWDNAVNAGQVI